MEKQCLICGLKKPLELHHIIEASDFGSNDNHNKVYLCRNHNWIASFGSEEEKEDIKKQIYTMTGKEGIQDIKTKEYFKKLVIAWQETRLGIILSDEDKINIEHTWEFYFLKKQCIMSRNKFGNPDCNDLYNKLELNYLSKNE